MAEIYFKKDIELFLRPQLNHLYFIETKEIMSFAIYTGILHAKKKHNFLSLDSKFIKVYHCDIDKCILSVEDVLYRNGLPKILVTPAVGKFTGSEYSYAGTLKDSRYAFEYPRLKKLFDNYGDKEAQKAHVRQEFSDLIQKVLTEKK